MSIDPSDQVTVKLEEFDAKSFKINVQAPFYNDPPPDTPGKVGEPLWKLWEFECKSDFLFFLFLVLKITFAIYSGEDFLC